MKLFLMTLLFSLSLAVSANAQRSDSIASVVNGDVITFTDLYDRMDLIIKSSRMPDTKEFKEKLLPQVLTALITEQIQLQEAARLGLSVTSDEIDKGFVELAGQNNLKADDFKAILQKQHINLNTLQNQIKSQLAWGKVIQREIRPRITLTDADIDSEVVRLRAREGQTEYFVAEIFLPVDARNSDGDVQKIARDLSAQLSQDVSKFPAAARQFSQSATAANGGIIGWVSPDQMNDTMAKAIQSADLKKVTNPIRDDEGYTILYVREKRQISLGKKAAEEKLRVKIAVFTLPDDQSDRSKVKQDVEDFAKNVKGCLDINEKVLKRTYASLDEIDDVPSAIPSDIQAAIKGLDIGEAGEIMRDGNTMSVPMLCGRDGGGTNSVLEREVENRIGTQRLDILQKRYLRDLITNAYIERRV